jgi:carboxypeptidase family protein
MHPKGWIGTVLFLLFALWAETASAQSAIAGRVRDNTGAVLPGATIEASSPALIEGVRTAITDGQGQYTIVNLRPGVYTVTITMEGFGKVVREGVELPANFTATIDETLSVGSIQETITVSGASPLVDVRQAQQTQVLPRSVLDSIVTARNTWTQASLVAGVTMSGTDVGGTRATNDLLLEAHGASALHSVYTVDGLMINTMRADGAEQMYYQDQSNEEFAIQTSGGSAEAQSGGVRLNMIPKEGGNRFSGGLYLGGSNGAWQADNFTQRLKDAGLTSVDKAAKIWDYGVTIGGPIMKDRLWFHESVRYWGLHSPVADVITDDGKQYVSTGRVISEVTRLTWKMSDRDKVGIYFDHQNKGSGPKFQATYPAKPSPRGIDPETGTAWQNGDWPYWIWNAKWTSTLTNRFIVEAGFSQTGTYVNTNPQGGVSVEPFSPEWYRRVRKTDLNLGTTWNAAAVSYAPSRRQVVGGSAAYVTGSHQAKVGTQLSFGDLGQRTDLNGHVQQQYRSGVPDAVFVYNYPVAFDNRLKYDLGFFAQDSWTVNQLTVNYGLRMDMLNSYVPAQDVPAGRFVGERHFAAVENAPDWGPTLSPRVGLAYDVFGNARTALKFSIGKYVTPHTTGLAQRLNPVALTTATIPWNDRDLTGRALPTNGDDIAQDNEIDLTRLPTNFGERQLDRLDPDLKREYNIETAVGAQHALTDRISIAAGWYRRSYKNQYITDNVFRDFDDYVPVEVVSPYNGEVFNVYNLRSVSELSQVDNVITNASKDRKWIYNGFEFSVQTRLRRGGNFLASSVTQRALTNECDERDDPNKLRFCDRFNLPGEYDSIPWRSDLKLAGSYPIAWGIQASAKFTSMPGRTTDDIVRVDELLPITWNIARTTRYTAEQCVGKPCTAGALVVPGMVDAAIVTPLAPSGAELFLERQNQLDLGLRKNIKVGRMDWSLQFDLFNALNADTIVAVRSVSTVAERLVNNFGTAAYMQPSAVLQARIPRIGVQMKW